MALVYLCFLLVIQVASATHRPIIGIVAQEVDTHPGYSSAIAASYVKAVEQSGGRVVPIFINRTMQYYRNILDSVNGVLFPGGGVLFTNTGGYADAGRIIVKYAKKRKAKNDHFPILGVCLGFELLVYLEVSSYDVLSVCNVKNVSLPLKFTQSFRKSQLYGRAPNHVIEILSHHPVTFNEHSKCVTKELMNRYNLEKKWHILSTSVNSNGTSFISSAEYHEYPIVGIIFHPEKIAFEWTTEVDIPHSKKALMAARHFYDWLVQESTKNNHSFSSLEEEYDSLIYNYSPYFQNGYYEQQYLFK